MHIWHHNNFYINRTNKFLVLTNIFEIYMARIWIIVGTMIRDRQGIKVDSWIEPKLQSKNHPVFFVDLLESNLLALLDRITKRWIIHEKKWKNWGKISTIQNGNPCYLRVYIRSTSSTIKNCGSFFWRI